MATSPRLFFLVLVILQLTVISPVQAKVEVGIWMKFEQPFISSKEYGNPLYEVKKFSAKFISPSGRIKKMDGFWDGGKNWKIRFAPDEKGDWSFETTCSDTGNTGLNLIKGSFTCIQNNSRQVLYQKGTIVRPKGAYHLSHADGTPFFWAGCTAWNGTLKSTDSEWETYLANREQTGYSVIQFVTTQWRGGDKNSLGQVAFEGSGKIQINAAFFRHLDGKIDKINEHGLVAAPVLLWALGSIQGRELSPGYYLPHDEAVLLAKYMVARYGGNQVIWILGGDGKYTEENEQRWKNIGRAVFNEEHPGVVALHPGGGSWIGEVYANEKWLDIIGYQSGHSNNARVANFINKGPVASWWDKLPPRPLINMEPVYEEIGRDITDADVRNAEYWSLLSAPPSGITYGANGIWPWLREGEFILNHGSKGEHSSRWNQSIKLPGSIQTGYLADFMRTLEWWNLRPCPELLVEQPGDKNPKSFVSVSRSVDEKTVLAYLPQNLPVRLYNLQNDRYEAEYFNPRLNKRMKGNVTGNNGTITIVPPAGESDLVLVLRRK